jgi:hypothetical protein
LLKTGLLDPYLSDTQRQTLQRASTQHDIWWRKAPPLFLVTLPAAEARSHVAAYAAKIGVDANDSILEKSLSGPLEFDALALDMTGKPIPVMHSDVGFALLFTSPTPAHLERSVDAILRPFPMGLLSPIGLLVANPAFAAPETQARFGKDAYHGTVVWSWQQAVLAAGLSRQLARSDLPANARTRLENARAELWSAIDATSALRTSELWTWSFSNGAFHAEPFGQQNTHADESNAAQLWSTVFLSFRQADWLGATALAR